MKMSREWAMPAGDTFSIPPIAAFVERWTQGREVIVDPFARRSTVGTITNDLDPEMPADYHLEASEFAQELFRQGIVADVVLFDPPYSPRQMAELYSRVGGREAAERSQNGRLYKESRDALAPLVRAGGVALSFGWQSAGFGESRGFAIREVLLVAHGGAHNDTICVAEERVQEPLL